MRNVIFIGCTKSKQKYRCPVEEMYSASTLYRKSLDYAKTFPNRKIYTVTCADHLVAEQGLMINPYDQDVMKEGQRAIKTWSKKTIKAILEKVKGGG